MKHVRGLLFLVVIALVGLQLAGCSKMPSAPTADVASVEDDGIGEDQIATLQEIPFDDFDIVRTWKARKKINYRKGGWIGKRNVAYLYIAPNSMSSRSNTRIFAQADLTSDRDLLFTFAPEGLKFNPSATLVINYKKLNASNVVLKWWNGSTWVKVSDSQDVSSSRFNWDRGSQKVTFDVDHFSIYLITRD